MSNLENPHLAIVDKLHDMLSTEPTTNLNQKLDILNAIKLKFRADIEQEYKTLSEKSQQTHDTLKKYFKS